MIDLLPQISNPFLRDGLEIVLFFGAEVIIYKGLTGYLDSLMRNAELA